MKRGVPTLCRFRSCLAVSLLWALALATAFAQPSPPDEVLGVWWSPKKDARIELYRTGQKLMGRVVWVLPEEQEHLDDKNPDQKLRGRRILGSTIFSDFTFVKGRWVDGKIYDPDSGKTYSCTMELLDSKTLSVHGYIGVPILGRSEKFTRFDEGKRRN